MGRYKTQEGMLNCTLQRGEQLRFVSSFVSETVLAMHGLRIAIWTAKREWVAISCPLGK